MSDPKNDEIDSTITKTQIILLSIFSVIVGCVFVCVLFGTSIIYILSRPDIPEILNRTTHTINSMFSFVKEIKPVSTKTKTDTVIIYQYQKPSKESFKIGDTVKTDDFIITLNSCQYQDSMQLSGSDEPATYNPEVKYLIFNVKYKNINNKDGGKIPYEDEAIVNYSGKKFVLNKVPLEGNGWGNIISEIDPLNSKLMNFVYAIPNEEMKNSVFWIPNINTKETFFVCDRIVPGKIVPNTDSTSKIDESHLNSDYN